MPPSGGGTHAKCPSRGGHDLRLLQQFRLWSKRAPGGERVSALVGGALALAVIAWLLVPPSHPSANVAVGTEPAAAASSDPGAVSASQPEAPAATGGGAAVAVADSSVAGGARTAPAAPGASSVGSSATTVASKTAQSSLRSATAGATSNGGADGCVSPPGSDQGVTPTQIKIAVILLDVVGPAGNATFGVASADTQQTWVEDVVSHINNNGGMACRKVTTVFFHGNPADPTNLQQTCLDVIQTQPFFVMDLGAYFSKPQLAVCYPQAHIGFISTAGIPASKQKQFYPYLFGQVLLEDLYRNMAFGLQQRGFFSASNGFTKLGVIYRDCASELYQEVVGWLNRAGLPSSQIVGYNMGCPAGFDSPSDIQAAILMFKQQGANSVTFINDPANFANFTIVAQQQGFAPRYGLADEGIVATSYGTTAPNYQNIANAVAITGARYGEERTPGYPPSASTQKCDAIFTAAGQPPLYQQQAGYGGVICNMFSFLQTGIEHAPSLARSNLAAGIHAAGSIDFSFPWGPSNFSSPGTTTGGQSWRVDQFMPSCQCWQVVDRDWHPAFAQ